MVRGRRWNFDMGRLDYRITIQPDYVLVERPSDYEVVWNEQPAMLMEMSALCKEADCRKVLILGPNTKVNLSILDIADLGKKIAELGLQIAMAESHDASNKEVNFLESIVVHRGGGLIQFFDTEKEAKDWLRIL